MLRLTLPRVLLGSWLLVALFPALAQPAPKPVKAGAVVTASVRTTSGGAPVRPAGVRCTGTIGGAKLRGVPKARRGTASCTYRTPLAARGKTLRGAILVTVRDKRFVRRFATRLT